MNKQVLTVNGVDYWYFVPTRYNGVFKAVVKEAMAQSSGEVSAGTDDTIVGCCCMVSLPTSLKQGTIMVPYFVDSRSLTSVLPLTEGDEVWVRFDQDNERFPYIVGVTKCAALSKFYANWATEFNDQVNIDDVKSFRVLSDGVFELVTSTEVQTLIFSSTGLVTASKLSAGQISLSVLFSGTTRASVVLDANKAYSVNINNGALKVKL